MREDLIIAGWTKSSFIDYPGTVATVLFLSGCNLRCPFCHNPEIVLDTLLPIQLSEILSYLKKRRGIIDGVVISGGEPTIYRRLPELVAILRETGIAIKLDTNGLNPEMIKNCAPDYLALDIKTVPSKYSIFGIPFDVSGDLEKSISLVRSMGSNAEIRIPAVPGFIDETDIFELITLLTGVQKVIFQPFDSRGQLLDPSLKQIEGYSKDLLKLWRDRFNKAGIHCTIRGAD